MMSVDQIIRLAQNGDVAAEERLAWLYHSGETVRKSEKKSFYWACRAAVSGHSPLGAYFVSVSYFNGEGVAASDVKAFLWAKCSARQGLAEADYALGVHYRFGYGVTPDLRRAVACFERAYQKNHNPRAASELANIYHYGGDGIKKSYVKAFRWTAAAAVYGDDPAIWYEMNLYYWRGLGVKKNNRKAFLWVKRSARQGFADAQLALGWHYLNGIGTAADMIKAERCFARVAAAQVQCGTAFYNLGYLYLNYHQNRETALRYFKQAYALDRHVGSAYQLARLLINVDIKEAKRLLKYAAKNNYSLAQRLLQSKRWADLCHFTPAK